MYTHIHIIFFLFSFSYFLFPIFSVGSSKQQVPSYLENVFNSINDTDEIFAINGNEEEKTLLEEENGEEDEVEVIMKKVNKFDK